MVYILLKNPNEIHMLFLVVATLDVWIIQCAGTILPNAELIGS
jgi:hypothetical protein